jgi:hypothetical protein
MVQDRPVGWISVDDLGQIWLDVNGTTRRLAAMIRHALLPDRRLPGTTS